MDATKSVRIFLDLPDYYSLAETIKQELLPSTGDQPTHVYVDSIAEADLVFDTDFVRTAGLEGMVGKLNEARGGTPLSITLGAALEVEEQFH